jgi:hypothetical protein
MDARVAEKHPTEAEADDHDSIEERGIRLKGEHVALVVGLFDENLRVTNTAQIRIEQSLAESAKAAARDMTGAISVRAIERAIADGGIAFKATLLEPLVPRSEPTRGSANTAAR